MKRGTCVICFRGGFYFERVYAEEKYTVAPTELPEELHWFKYREMDISLLDLHVIAHFTGRRLLYWGAEAYLIDPEVADLGQFEAWFTKAYLRFSLASHSFHLLVGGLSGYCRPHSSRLSHSDADQKRPISRALSSGLLR